MRMPIGNAPQVVAEFFQSVVLPAAQKAGSNTPFFAAFVGGLVSRNAPKIIEAYAPWAKAAGIIDAENMIDIDLLHDIAVEALEKAPLSVMGYKPDREDFDKLQEIMKRYGS